LTKTKFGLLGFLAIAFIAIALRPPVASLGPLLEEIQSTLGIGSAQISLLAAAPVFCFGLGAFASPWLVSRFSLNRAMLNVLVLLALALSFRIFFGYPGLLIGTVAAGLSIAIANVLLPTVVRMQFPNRVPLITGAYTTVLGISASVAASVAVPSSNFLGGFNFALAIWIVPVLLAIVLWAPQTINQIKHIPQVASIAAEEKAAVNRSPIAWAIVFFFGIQSLGFYSLLGWMPTALLSIGVTAQDAGNYLGFASAIGIPSGLVVSYFLGKFKSLSFWAAGASLVTLAGFILFTSVLITASSSLLLFACILIGFGMAATFPLALSLISSRASSQAQTTQLSSLAQGVGYLFAAIGTFLVGYFAIVTSSWPLSFSVIAGLTVVQVGIGFYAGKPGVIANK
jgi:CP family cyanate transporter-like MFS transporter